MPQNSHLVARNELEPRMSEKEQNVLEKVMNGSLDTLAFLGNMFVAGQPGIHG